MTLCRRGFFGFVRFNSVEAVAVGDLVDFEFDFVADFVPDQRLGHGGEVADDIPFRVRVPGAENGKAFRLVGGQVGCIYHGAGSGDVRAHASEVGAARAHQFRFQVGFAPQEEFLHFLGGFVFVFR